MPEIPSRISSQPWRCPSCSGPLMNLGDVLMCLEERLSFPREHGMVFLLAPGRAERLSGLLPRLTAIRIEDGWRLSDYEHPELLPDVDPEHAQAPLWQQRKVSWDAVVGLLKRLYGASRLKVLDLGASSGWMSHRLAGLGHEVLACDPNPDGEVGLGAAGVLAGRRYFERIVCEMESLPLQDGSVDAVISSGSFHYAQSKESAMDEVCRVLKSGGAFVLTDTPIFSNREDGQLMSRQFAAVLEAEHGAGPWVDEPFLVHGQLKASLESRGLNVQAVHLKRGWRWKAYHFSSYLTSSTATADYPLISAVKSQAGGSF